MSEYLTGVRELLASAAAAPHGTLEWRRAIGAATRFARLYDDDECEALQVLITGELHDRIEAALFLYERHAWAENTAYGGFVLSRQLWPE